VDDGDDEVDAALAAARAAFDSVCSRTDDPAKFKAVSLLADGFQKLGNEAAAERRSVVRRIRDRDKLKLAPLAEQLSMSTTRVHQLINPRKKDDEHV
jgi:hypothetical protein